MNAQEILSGGFGIVVILFLGVLAILLFLMPFFIYGTNNRTKETSEKLTATNNLLMEIRGSLKRVVQGVGS